MDKKTQTIKTYNESATALALKFDKLGARVSDIKETFLLTSKKHPKVLEIGCGNDRDAQEIVKYTDDYLGLDISEKLVELARRKVPQVRFEVVDIEAYNFPENLDIVFAFASLLHVPKVTLKVIFERLLNSLNIGGVVRISLKHSDTYTEITNKDEFGVRTYYHYSLQDIKDITKGFTFIKNDLASLNGQSWLEIILKKE